MISTIGRWAQLFIVGARVEAGPPSPRPSPPGEGARPRPSSWLRFLPRLAPRPRTRRKTSNHPAAPPRPPLPGGEGRGEGEPRGKDAPMEEVPPGCISVSCRRGAMSHAEMLPVLWLCLPPGCRSTGAPTARFHTSLGQRPRVARQNGPRAEGPFHPLTHPARDGTNPAGRMKRVVGARAVGGVADLGRWPRLV